VIGKTPDTADYALRKGVQVFRFQGEYSLMKNYEWLSNAVKAGAPFKVVSPTTAENFFNSAGTPTAFAREIWYLMQNGYRRIGQSNIWAPNGKL
jgi:hypothetical protein